MIYNWYNLCNLFKKQSMPAQEDLKKIVGEYAAGLIGDNALIGLGSGSTVYWFIQGLAERVKQD